MKEWILPSFWNPKISTTDIPWKTALIRIFYVEVLVHKIDNIALSGSNICYAMGDTAGNVYQL
jgi:hypothetical protein